MLNNNSINKTKYLNIIFLILILISIKDIIFKSEIYILEINENSIIGYNQSSIFEYRLCKNISTITAE